MTIRKFNRVVMVPGDCLLTCRKIAVAYLTLRRGQPKKPRCVISSPLGKAISVPGRRQTATSRLSGAAKPRVPVPKLCVTSLSPTAAGGFYVL